MNIKRKLLAILAAGMLMLSVTGSAGATPNEEHANCIARWIPSLDSHGISSIAHEPKLENVRGNPSLVGYDARTDCPA